MMPRLTTYATRSYQAWLARPLYYLVLGACCTASLVVVVLYGIFQFSLPHRRPQFSNLPMPLPPSALLVEGAIPLTRHYRIGKQLVPSLHPLGNHLVGLPIPAAGPGRVLPIAASQLNYYLPRQSQGHSLPIPVVPSHAPLQPIRRITRVLPDCTTQASKCVALTFDDGPSPLTTNLLRHLSEHQARATFFTIGGEVAKRPEVVRLAHKAGHAIGNHSWSHPDLAQLTESALHEQIRRTNEIIKQHTGQYPRVTRPPYGSMSPLVKQALAEHNQAIIYWSVDTRDWAKHEAEPICQQVMQEAKPGSIILLHDIKPSSVQAGVCIIKALTAQGYTFVTIPQLFGKLTPGEVYRYRSW